MASKPHTPTANRKIQNDMSKRGWTETDIQSTVAHPSQTGKAIDRTRGNTPATVYADKNGNYVIVNNQTGNIVQVSDKNRPWIPDSSIVWDDE